MKLLLCYYVGSVCAFLAITQVHAVQAQEIIVPTLNFFVINCDEKLKWIDPHSGPAEGVIRKYWRDDHVFVIEYFVKTYCGGVTFSGDYEMRDSLLVLKHTVAQGVSITKCLCAHRLIYEFLGLPKRDYSIALESKH